MTYPKLETMRRHLSMDPSATQPEASEVRSRFHYLIHVHERKGTPDATVQYLLQKKSPEPSPPPLLSLVPSPKSLSLPSCIHLHFPFSLMYLYCALKSEQHILIGSPIRTWEARSARCIPPVFVLIKSANQESEKETMD